MLADSSCMLVRHAHILDVKQFEYIDMLASECGEDVEVLPAWRKQMYIGAGDLKKSHPESYRDAEVVQDYFDDAQRDFNNLFQKQVA